MTKAELLACIDEILEQPPGTLNGREVLADIARWDSFAIMAFIALLDQKVGIIVPAERILTAVTVNDLVKLAGDRIREE